MKVGRGILHAVCVVRTLVAVLQLYHSWVYDPCCGSGGMFVQPARFVESHAGNINDIFVYGQDSNPTTWKMAQMNLDIRGIDADLAQHEEFQQTPQYECNIQQLASQFWKFGMPQRAFSQFL